MHKSVLDVIPLNQEDKTREKFMTQKAKIIMDIIVGNL